MTNITGAPTTGTMGTEIDLTGATVNPSDATNKTIVWSVKDAGTTGVTTANLTTGKFTPATAGTLVLTATITNGLTASTNYTQDCTLTISDTYKAVTNITGTPTTGTTGLEIDLTGATVNPSDSTNKTIMWSVKDAGTTGVTTANLTTGKLTPATAGTLVLTATITNGLTASTNYTQDCTLTISDTYKAVTNITGAPTTGTMGTEIDLTSVTVNPIDATNKTIVWSVKDAGTTGVATANLTTGKFTQATAGTPTTGTKGTEIDLTGAAVNPSDATNKTIVWSVKNAGTTSVTTANLSTGKFTPATVGTLVLTATITNGLTASTNYTQDVTITVAASGSSDGSSGSSGGGGSSTVNASTSTTTNVIVNGQSQNAGTVATSKDGDKTVTTVTIDDKKIQEKLNAEGMKSTLSILISGTANIGVGVLNGKTVKEMETKDAVLEIKINSTTYTLPATEINIDHVSLQIGQAVELKDIKISVKIAEPSADTAKIIQNTAFKNKYHVVVKPVDFEITCSNGSKTVNVSKFSAYVERMLAIPDGIDSSKITTGIVLNSNGTFSHVPTTIVKVNGKYYAKINSLTNSTYSVIYNPLEFNDVTKHWAKDAINDMGSRLIVSGIGNGNYGPNTDITRAEFAAIIVKALGLTAASGESHFSDVKTSSWYAGYVETAVSYNIITGYSEAAFGPNDKITREQVMTMIARAMKLTGLYSSLTDTEISTQIAIYTDGSSASNYAKTGIAVCLKTGLVSGKTRNSLAPKDYITRAEVAIIIERMLQKSGLI